MCVCVCVCVCVYFYEIFTCCRSNFIAIFSRYNNRGKSISVRIIDLRSLFNNDSSIVFSFYYIFLLAKKLNWEIFHVNVLTLITIVAGDISSWSCNDRIITTSPVSRFKLRKVKIPPWIVYRTGAFMPTSWSIAFIAAGTTFNGFL